MTDGPLQVESDRLYDQYVRPLESENWRAYVAVSANGEIRMGRSVGELVIGTRDNPGPDIHIFRIGPRVMVWWR